MTEKPKKPDENSAEGQTTAEGKADGKPEFRPVTVAPLDPTSVASEKPAIRPSAIGAVRVTLSVELGRIDIPLKNIRGTKQGGVISLDRTIGEPIDVRVNGKLIARGEVVATESQKYGVRITEIVSEEGDPED